MSKFVKIIQPPTLNDIEESADEGNQGLLVRSTAYGHQFLRKTQRRPDAMIAAARTRKLLKSAVLDVPGGIAGRRKCRPRCHVV
eukprot:scaffold1964_cov302-Pinguiococcus_pyrenoidosus.AAC.2